jgi:hypothetical protein
MARTMALALAALGLAGCDGQAAETRVAQAAAADPAAQQAACVAEAARIRGLPADRVQALETRSAAEGRLVFLDVDGVTATCRVDPEARVLGIDF